VAALSEKERGALMAIGRRRRFQSGDTLFHEGDASDWLALLLEGRVKVSYFTEDGREIVLAVRDPGDLLGELSALDGKPRSATVTAMEPVELLTMTADEFNRFLEAHPRVAVALIVALVRRLRETDVRLVEFGAYDSVGRVARRLIELAEKWGRPDDGGIIITVPLSQQELAGWTGSSRESVAKALQMLRSLGWVETERRRLVVRDMAALRRRAG